MDRNGLIGAAGRLPWHASADLKRFKARTMGHHLVMGRKTFESIGRLLPGRTSVIVTRQADYRVPGAVVAHSLSEAIEHAAGDTEVFVIGGAELFRDALPIADRIYVTEVEGQYQGDVFFPDWPRSDWRAISRERIPAVAEQPALSFVTWERLRSPAQHPAAQRRS
jgi:dihydrofolate reductase